MFKNLTLQQISLMSAGAISIGLTVVLLILDVITAMQIGLWLYVSGFVCVFTVTYFVNMYLFERYIFRRVKVIYKLIRKSKVSVNKDVEFSLSDNLIDKVETEVSQWIADQNREIQSLKKLEKYRRNFLGNISHELKTPIFTIQGYIHTLIDGGIHDDNINVSYLERAARNVERLQTIVEDLEIISSLESGKVALDIQTFDIRELANEVFHDLEMQAVERDISLSLKDGMDRPFNVKADKENIRQVLINLVSNSIKYGKDGGRTKIGFYDMDKYILVEVSDNGIGISDKHLPHVFDRFYRIDKSRSRSHQGGSGLGLSIVKHILEAHHQTINVRSTEGVGSTFGFTLEKA